DFNGCTEDDSSYVAAYQPINISLFATDETCADDDGFIDLTVSGGTAPYTFNWTGGFTVQNISGLSNGTYNVTVT
ncbi:MAG: SprB repeat-containing protein, partial [Bacteroidia bacterium]|nr:SprB repeat-containing protein [Bacteroidia bacterium]